MNIICETAEVVEEKLRTMTIDDVFDPKTISTIVYAEFDKAIRKKFEEEFAEVDKRFHFAAESQNLSAVGRVGIKRDFLLKLYLDLFGYEWNKPKRLKERKNDGK